MNSYNIGTVIGFEVRRTLGKPLFWLITLSIPLLMIGIGALSVLSNTSLSESISEDDSQTLTIKFIDHSGRITAKVAQELNLTKAPDAEPARAAVQAGELDALIVFPKDLLSESTQIFGKDRGLTKNFSYSRLATKAVQQSAAEQLANPELLKLSSTNLNTTDIIYLPDGSVSSGFLGTIIPGAFLILFYLSVIMLGNQMMNITMEEKENRVSEMILTTMHPTTLLVGKIVAVVVIGFAQAVLLGGLGGLATAVMRSGVVNPGSDIPGIDWSSVTISPVPVLLGIAFYLAGFLLFTGALVCIGAIMPTAKDASSSFAFVILAMFLPVYLWGVVAADPHGVVSQIMTFFPLTAPIMALLRNTLGMLFAWEAALSLAIIAATGVGLLWLGGKLFRTGSLSYDTKLNVKKVLGLERAKTRR